MAKELDAILDHGEAYHAASCTTDSGSVSFLSQIICPIYDIMARVSEPFFDFLSVEFIASYILAWMRLRCFLCVQMY